MVSFKKLLLCLFFFFFQFSQVMSLSSHVVHEYKTSVFFLFLKRFAFRAYNACNAILAWSHTLYLYCELSQGSITRGFYRPFY